MADIDLDKLLAQRAEARGDDGKTIAFKFKDQEWTFLDPLMLSDDEKDELADVEHDVDIASWYMGDDQYDKFVAAGGNSSLFFHAFRAHMQSAQAEIEGKPTRPNRSSRRMASKKSKQR